MYTALILILLAAAAACIILGVIRRRPLLAASGVLLVGFTIVFFKMLSFWGEMLWFSSLGFEQRFWRVLLAQYGLALLTAILAWAVLHLATTRLPAQMRIARWGSRALAAVIGFFWGLRTWQLILKFMAGVKAGHSDPILGLDAGFYLFSLPFWDALYGLVFWLILLAMAVLLAGAYLRFRPSGVELEQPPADADSLNRLFPPLFTSAGCFFLVLAGGGLARALSPDVFALRSRVRAGAGPMYTYACLATGCWQRSWPWRASVCCCPWCAAGFSRAGPNGWLGAVFPAWFPWGWRRFVVLWCGSSV